MQKIQQQGLSLTIKFAIAATVLAILAIVPVVVLFSQAKGLSNEIHDREQLGKFSSEFNAAIELTATLKELSSLQLGGVKKIPASFSVTIVNAAKRLAEIQSNWPKDSALENLPEGARDTVKAELAKWHNSMEALNRARGGIESGATRKETWNDACNDAITFATKLRNIAAVPQRPVDRMAFFSNNILPAVTQLGETDSKRQGIVSMAIAKGAFADGDTRDITDIKNLSEAALNIINPASKLDGAFDSAVKDYASKRGTVESTLSTSIANISKRAASADIEQDNWLAACRNLDKSREALKEQVNRIIDESRTAVAKEARTLTLLNWTIAILSVAVLAGFIWWLHTQVLSKIKTLTRVAILIGEGHEDSRAPECGSDEIGVLAQTFNAMMEAQQKNRAERDADYRILQAGAHSLLATTAQVSTGDLSVRVPHITGALGQVGLGLNSMLDNFTKVIRSVQDLATKVDISVKEIRESSESHSEGAVKQAQQVAKTNTAIAQMAEQIQKVSSAAEQSSKAAEQTRNVAEGGSASIKEVIDGMEQVRFNVLSGAKKIKRLGERSMEISTIAGTITDISAQTDIIALNSALDAARTEQADNGFSESVRRLSDRVNSATSEISELISAMQADTNDSVASMEKQTTEVEEESRIVMRAGKSLERIHESSLQSAQLVNQINESVKRQAMESEEVVHAMSVVQDIVEDSKRATAQSLKSAEDLAVLSGNLAAGISQFRISESTHTADTPAGTHAVPPPPPPAPHAAAPHRPAPAPQAAAPHRPTPPPPPKGRK